ncbi:MerR family transcriptional regulator [Paenibacillus protaetiae]|uniref:MerR family transcriptional regulator n=1 Tax=Paenibacillus protaetiae TaxID=2509456 RepID=A0A4P6EZ87_9BACL|nr:MerR family transcriptional regulator [Paenibacillus protaetiae]QAY67593.1 MerR family transcriptional regulator [Paenibacillus protaetiae]
MVGLTKRTLRYYEEIGLLPPPERSVGGFRLYTDKHVEHLNRLINARDVLGFSLQELQQFVAIGEQFNNQRAEIRQTEDNATRLNKIAEMEQTISEQLHLLDQKLEKINAVRADLNQLNEKLLAAKTKLLNDME